MFPRRYFANSMFAPRYFPKTGATVDLISDPALTYRVPADTLTYRVAADPLTYRV